VDFIKINNFSSLKEGKPRPEKKIFAKDVSNTGLLSKIYKELLPTIPK
jgi:hypothetical protein